MRAEQYEQLKELSNRLAAAVLAEGTAVLESGAEAVGSSAKVNRKLDLLIRLQTLARTVDKGQGKQRGRSVSTPSTERKVANALREVDAEVTDMLERARRKKS